MSEPVKPKSAAAYLNILRETTPETYHAPLFNPLVPEANALFRALARSHAFLAQRGYEVAQAQYFRTHSTADADPASSWREASGLVTLERKLDLQEPRYVDKGAMVLVGPAGRSWANDAAIYWRPFDPLPEREVLFVATSPGLIGNLDHLADDAGLITKEREGAALALLNNEPDLEVVFHADLSEGRTGRDASVLAPENFRTYSKIRDSGKPDQFSATNRGIYIRIDDSAVAANNGRLLLVKRVLTPGVELPPGSGLYPHEIEVDDLPLLVPLLSALQDNGGVFTDYTAAADDDTADDVQLLPAVPVVGDAFYFGFADPFLGVAIAITTPADGEHTLAWEAWDGALWRAFPDIVDDTGGFKLAGELRIEAPAPAWFWTTTAVNGLVAYWLRARVTAVTLVGTQPLAAKIKILKPNRLTVESGTLQWSMLDWKDLRIDITQIEAFSGGRDDTLGLLGEERGVPKQTGESDDDYRERIANLADVVTPAAINRAINRILSPYLYRGKAQDVQNGMTGLFCDAEDAADFYLPGAIYPLDPYKLLYTDGLAYGGFEVLVPYLTDGEWGCSCDDGPIVYLDSPYSVFLGPAADCCFLDGGPILAAATYAALWTTVNDAKLFGVDFLMIHTLLQNVPAC